LSANSIPFQWADGFDGDLTGVVHRVAVGARGDQVLRAVAPVVADVLDVVQFEGDDVAADRVTAFVAGFHQEVVLDPDRDLFAVGLGRQLLRLRHAGLRARSPGLYQGFLAVYPAVVGPRFRPRLV
jgi:hypothetical protein